MRQGCEGCMTDESCSHVPGTERTAKYDDGRVNLDIKWKNEKVTVMDTLTHLLTSGLGPATEPGQVKVTNSWHLLWTTKLQTRGNREKMSRSQWENHLRRLNTAGKKTITQDLSLPWHWNPCLPMPLSEEKKATWIKTQIQSSRLLFKVKYFASETVSQPEEYR